MQSRTLLQVGAVAAGCVFALAGCQAPEPTRSSKMSATSAAQWWRFDDIAANEIPAGWSIAQTNPTVKMANWSVVNDDSSPSSPHAFALTESSNYNGTYNLAMAEQSRFQNLKLSVVVKAVQGEEDQGGGPIWRCLDAKNYYIARFNPLESNFRVYVVSNGRRRQLDSASVNVETSKWYTIDVSMEGDSITCYLDGEKLLEVDDPTIRDAGMVGLWTKADAVTSFDDLAVIALP